MDNKELVKQWARDDCRAGLTLGEFDYGVFCEYCADQNIQCSQELFDEYLNEVEKVGAEEYSTFNDEDDYDIDEDIEVKVKADEPNELASFAKCILGDNCEFYDQEFDMPPVRTKVEPIDEDELEEAQCKYYKVITHPDDDMKQLKEGFNKEEMDQLFKLCDELGIQTLEDLENFKNEHPGDLLDELMKHRASLGARFKVKPDERGLAGYNKDKVNKDIADLKKDLGEDFTEDDDMSDEEFIEAFGKAMVDKNKGCKDCEEQTLTEGPQGVGLFNKLKRAGNAIKNGITSSADANKLVKWQVAKYKNDNKTLVQTSDVKDHQEACKIAQNWSKINGNGIAKVTASGYVNDDIANTFGQSQAAQINFPFTTEVFYKNKKLTGKNSKGIDYDRYNKFVETLDGIAIDIGGIDYKKLKNNNNPNVEIDAEEQEQNTDDQNNNVDNNQQQEVATETSTDTDNQEGQVDNNKPENEKPEDNKPQDNKPEDDRPNYTLVGDEGVEGLKAGERGDKLKGRLAVSKDLNKLKLLRDRINANSGAKIYNTEWDVVNESLQEDLDSKSNVEAATEKLKASLKADGFEIDEKESGSDRIYVKLTTLDDYEIANIFDDRICDVDCGSYTYLNVEDLSDYERENFADDFWDKCSLDIDELENEYNVNVNLDASDIGSDDIYCRVGDYHDSTYYDSGYKDDDEIEGPMEVWGYIYITDK